MHSSELNVIQKGKCPTLSGKSTLRYEVAQDPQGNAYWRIAENTGGGFFSAEWVSAQAIEHALSQNPERITSLALFRLYKGKSVNTPAFLLAALRHEGVVELLKGRQRKHRLVDIGKLGANPAPKKATPKKAQPKKVSAKKAAPKKATPNKA